MGRTSGSGFSTPLSPPLTVSWGNLWAPRQAVERLEKHPQIAHFLKSGGNMDERIAEAIRRHLDQEGMLSCAAAFRVAEELGVKPLEVGRTADEIGVKLNRCQLGLFGYGPKAEGRHKIVRPAESVSPELAQAIRDSLSEGHLTCRTAWDIAAVLGIPKMDVAAAAERLEIRITRCQLGAF